MTTPEEETELFLKAKAGDEAAREFLIHNHLLFAARYGQSLVKGSLPMDEVISAANYAVVLAFEAFDPARGYRFTTYLRFIIQSEVSKLWRSKFSGGVPDPSLGGPNGETRGFDNWESGSRVASNKEIASEEPSAEDLDLTKFNRAALARAMANLSEKGREMITLRYSEDLSLTDIGIRWGVTREAVRTYHNRLMARLKKVLVKEGVER